MTTADGISSYTSSYGLFGSLSGSIFSRNKRNETPQHTSHVLCSHSPYLVAWPPTSRARRPASCLAPLLQQDEGLMLASLLFEDARFPRKAWLASRGGLHVLRCGRRKMLQMNFISLHPRSTVVVLLKEEAIRRRWYLEFRASRLQRPYGGVSRFEILALFLLTAIL